jgi:succinyl-diaminopimelate desuccinylase
VTSVVTLLQDLIRCPSVTPLEGGALAFLDRVLTQAGFVVSRPVFREEGTPDVENLYARLGIGSPCLMFAGHTDVVPVGQETDWTHAPFSGEIVGERLYGRGAVDMKGGIAAFLAAVLNHLKEHGPPKGSIVFLITGDEEGPSINGTEKLLKWAHERGETFDHCIVGEPTNPETLGDMIKIGRRGSLSAVIDVEGLQGHVAYPQRAKNPVPVLLDILNLLRARKLDNGNAHFDPSNLEITSLDVGNTATNVIPARAQARLNIRFNNEHARASLKSWIEETALEAGQGITNVSYPRGSSESFLTAPGPFVELVSTAIEAETGRKPALSTSGGTSDARFIKNYGPVIEFGLVGQTMHMVDEHVAVSDLEGLTRIYGRVLKDYFAG